MKIYNLIQAARMLVIAAFFLVIAGCDSFLEEKEIPRITADFYSTRQGVEAAKDAVYSYMRYGLGGEYVNLFTELGNDLISGADGALGYAINTYGAGLNSTMSNFYGYWENCYKGINVTNEVLQALDNTDMTDSERKVAFGEMSFLRAYYYFDLVQQFGKIPLVTEAVHEARTSFKRASVAEVYQLIIADLRNAEANLPETPSATGKATKYAAAHLLSKAYLTRCSAVTDDRGQKATDADSALYYAQSVINSGKYALLDNFSNLWSMDNMGNKEVVFSIQFTTNLIYNGSGNLSHLYWTAMYENKPGMVRDIENGRPYRFHRATNRTFFELFDRKNDARFYKSFKWVFYCNRATATLAIGDTAIYYSLNPPRTDRTYLYTYTQWNKDAPNSNNTYYPPLLKYIDNKRAAMNDTGGSREWVRMRLGETYLLAAEAAGRKGDFDLAATYINVIRQRASWKEGETKMSQYWVEEGGAVNDKNSTYPLIEVKANDLKTNFVDFILDERGRELLGEYMRWEDLVRYEKLYEYVSKHNPDAAPNIREYHKLRPIPQNHIDRLNPRGTNEEEQNQGYF